MSIPEEALALAQAALKNLDLPYPNIDTSPILLTPPQGRGTRREVLSTSLRRIDDDCAALDVLMNTLQTIKRQSRARRAAIIHATAPIFAVPPEVLSEIFYGAVTTANYPATCAETISHVCAYWREVAVARSDLWNNVRFDRKSPFTPHMVDACLARSVGRPLKGTIMHDNPSFTLCTSIETRARLKELHILVNSSVRETVQFQIVRITGKSSFRDPRPPRHFPAVHILTVECADDLDFDDSPLETLGLVFPSLHELRLIQTPASMFLTIPPTVTSLRISSPLDSVDDMAWVVMNLPHIQSLYLEGCQGSYHTWSESTPLLHLHILEFKTCTNPFMMKVLGSLIFPSLHTLVIHVGDFLGLPSTFNPVCFRPLSPLNFFVH